MQFVANLNGVDREAAADNILSQELLLMEKLHYHLTVHNPYRPMEGLLIDVKVCAVVGILYSVNIVTSLIPLTPNPSLPLSLAPFRLPVVQ